MVISSYQSLTEMAPFSVYTREFSSYNLQAIISEAQMQYRLTFIERQIQYKFFFCILASLLYHYSE